jgi:hypothetical protein
MGTDMASTAKGYHQFYLFLRGDLIDHVIDLIDQAVST